MLYCVRLRIVNIEFFLVLFYVILNYMLYGYEYLYLVFEYYFLNICKLYVDLFFVKNF